MSDGFTRTPTGVVGSRYFFPNPIIWVEGPTDIYFYEPVLGSLRCNLKPFHGASNAAALIHGLLIGGFEYPYAVILDGDYGILSEKRSVHRWVVSLRRYSFENYFWERESLNRSCLKQGQSGERVDVVGPEFDRVEQHLEEQLRELVELDVAARRSDPAPKVFPDRVEALLLDPEQPDICPQKVAKHVAKARAELTEEAIQEARKDVAEYLRRGRFVFLLNGHVLFGVIQRVFTQTAAAIRGKKVVLNDDALTQLLAEMMWRTLPSDEHRRLRRKIVSLARELNAAQMAA
jgi:glycine/D-amino acid oxidase-like deaminating enzyme